MGSRWIRAGAVAVCGIGAWAATAQGPQVKPTAAGSPPGQQPALGAGDRVVPERFPLVAAERPGGLEAISGRNKLPGTVKEIRYEGLLVQVTIDVAGYEITSIITSDSARALGLKEGVQVYALVKATEVMVIRG
jgi:molybdopterin-binding protein